MRRLTAVATGSRLSAGALGALLGRLGGFLVIVLVVGLLVIPRSIRWIARLERSEPLMVASFAVCFGRTQVRFGRPR